MTENYDPYENAMAEKVNGILKQEFFVSESIEKLEVNKQLIRESIDL
ncbi:hypothetical protein ACFO3O_21965 [Dokdonia ponticola]|uniref:Integrase catalytic domain-containing protein n=1 Tax=Dokdonia ponticola TaxID=2041041 RepID=A0ABV9I2E6_9FLAO